MGEWRVIQGRCEEVLADLELASVDAIVTDPPYEIGYLGRGWDSTGIAWNRSMWGEALRVLKPGGHLISFAATRTYHRLAVAVEDAGFQIRDMVLWIYGQGQPKSQDVSRAIDDRLGYEREVIGTKTVTEIDFEPGAKPATKEIPVTAPASDAAKLWEGWGTALKPACEPMVFARKPLNGTVVENVLEFGVGALNIDGSRLDPGDEDEGRWPSNVLMDPEAADLVDAQTGDLPKVAVGFEPPGGVSRFFYVAKPSQRERQAGLGEAQQSDVLWSFSGPRSGPEVARNDHPTVKPITLMRYLVQMVTQPGALVLDPFCGSGSTGLAALLESRRFLGIELEQESVDLADARYAYLKSGGEF